MIWIRMKIKKKFEDQLAIKIKLQQKRTQKTKEIWKLNPRKIQEEDNQKAKNIIEK